MPLIRFRNRDNEKELSKVLDGILSSGEETVAYGTRSKSSNSGFLFLPLDSNGSSVHSLFVLEGRLAEAPIGFMYNSGFLRKSFYRVNVDGGIVREAEQPNVLYLPLVKTDFKGEVGKYDIKKVFKPYAGSPFPILGLKKGNTSLPLVFFKLEGEEISLKGIYLGQRNEAGVYNKRNKTAEEICRKVLGRFNTIAPSETSNKPRKVAARKNSHVKKDHSADFDWHEPRSIVKYLDRFIIGQEQAKRIVSVAFCNYMHRVNSEDKGDLPKDNLLLVGPSGVGKTYMVSLLARKANLPFAQGKATGKSSTGYKGENLAEIFSQISDQAGRKEDPYGVVFVDEIDKLVGDDSVTFGGKLQDELIGWSEEAIITLEKQSERGARMKDKLNTRNLLFVTAGAFQSYGSRNSLEELVRSRLSNGQNGFGFGSKLKTETKYDERNILFKVKPEDLIKYGLKPELVGRLPSIAPFTSLSQDELVMILSTAERSPLTQYTQLLKARDYRIEIMPEVLAKIASLCPKETGARAIHGVCNDLFTEILFEPENFADVNGKIKITPELAANLINLH